MQGALGGHVFPRSITRLQGGPCESRRPHDSSCTDPLSTLPTVILIQIPTWTVPMISKCLRTAQGPPVCSSNCLPKWPTGASNRLLRGNKPQLNCLVSPPPLVTCSCLLVAVGYIVRPTTRSPSPNNRASPPPQDASLTHRPNWFRSPASSFS